MDKRYQVFVSSTYEDLREERQEVMRALLELDCMPSGMELFPAADDDQWTLIKRVIAESDYYIVISAGRYGSLGAGGISYTEMEYRYAVDCGKPVLGFLHKDPGQLPAAQCEATDDGRAKLTEFRKLVGQRMCKFWSTASELGSVVSRSLVQQIKAKPGVGWIRADEVAEAVAAPEILRLKRQVEDLQARLERATNIAPAGAERLAQGAQLYVIDFSFDSYDRSHASWTWSFQVSLSWDDIFYDLGPIMLDEASEAQLRAAANRMVQVRSDDDREADRDLKGHTGSRNFRVSDDDYQTIKIQLRGLGLIMKSEKAHSVRDTGTYWTLTPYGDQLLTTLRAIPRETPVSGATISQPTPSNPAQPAATSPPADSNENKRLG
jgi:Domain of unknown function (DUF4062)